MKCIIFVIIFLECFFGGRYACRVKNVDLKTLWSETGI